MSEAPWRELAEIARWTPSPHNTQPWRIAPVDGTTADILIVRERTLPDEDTTGCFIRCAMGMFLESLSIAASHAGWMLDALAPVRPETEALLPFARVALSPRPATVPADPLTPGDILARRTSRLPPTADRIAETDLRALAEIASAAGQALTWTSDAPAIEAIMAANLDAVAHDLADQRYGAEIRRWFRYTHRQAARTRDGLDARCMRLPPHELFLTAHAPRLLQWPVTRGVMRSRYQARLGPTHQMAFLSGPFFDPPAAAPAAGRALMRLWLEMHRRGIGIHPFGNLVTNAGAHAALTARTGTPGIWLAFRIGRTALPPRSARLETGSVLCAEG